MQWTLYPGMLKRKAIVLLLAHAANLPSLDHCVSKTGWTDTIEPNRAKCVRPRPATVRSLKRGRI